jgi:type IV pilus assembly protein PilY1
LVTLRTFTPGTTGAATLLKDPLWYAAKWGGFQDQNTNDLPDLTTEWDENGDGTPDNYFLVTNALTLGAQLRNAFNEVLSRTSSASAVATNSTPLDTNTLIYQAQFRTDDWTGKLLAYHLNTDGTLGSLAWEGGNKLPAYGSRNIYTRNADTATGAAFDWASIGTTHQAALNVNAGGTTDTFGDQRIGWLRGDTSTEQRNGGIFRNRSVALGDIINSDPQFAGAQGNSRTTRCRRTRRAATPAAFRLGKINTRRARCSSRWSTSARTTACCTACPTPTGVRAVRFTMPSTPILRRAETRSWTWAARAATATWTAR